MTRPNVAVIGLGNMGGPMAANLVKAGVTVNGFDVVDAAKTKAAEAGVTVHDTAVDAAQASDVIITMLPNGGLVAQVLIDIIDAVGDNAKTFVDCSTISVGEAQSNAELVGARGHRYLDAPVSGGVAGAAAGTLAELKEARLAHTGDASPLTLANRLIGTLDKADKPTAGKLLGGARGRIAKALTARQETLEAAAEEEKDEFDVVLEAAGDKKIQVIKEVRALTSLGLKEAKELVDGAPKPVLEGANKEAAEKAKEQLEGAGATVTLK